MGHVRELDAIFTQVYRKDPVQLGQWKIAKRVTPYGSAEPAQAPDPGSGTGGSGTPPTGS
jgi:hypothetical protein